MEDLEKEAQVLLNTSSKETLAKKCVWLVALRAGAWIETIVPTDVLHGD